MNILGPDTLVFGVDDVAACTQYLIDYGLKPVSANAASGRFEALDGTGVVIAHKDDPLLPPRMETSSMLRKTIYGVADAGTLQAIEVELRKDREVRRLPDGSLEAVDDLGFVLGFQLTVRRPLELQGEAVNAPGVAVHRPVNDVGMRTDRPAVPRSLSHVVYFVPDIVRAEAFYTRRLGFTCTDRFTDVGPFLRPAGTREHHTLFMIKTPPFMKGVDHFTFHVGGPTELMLAGTRFAERGYQSFWGPGRHLFGSNWFWYFNSPLGCKMEYDADMDLHDEHWQPRSAPSTADTSQAFLFTTSTKWVPGGPPPSAKSAEGKPHDTPVRA
jgi:catechol 2,3-dioxygenase-like lactoylglutathione lyase family enzyme